MPNPDPTSPGGSRLEIDGGCHCGRIRFRATIDPAEVTVCHCTDCQRLTGTAFRVSVTAPRANLAVDGEPRVYTKIADSGRARHQYFCPACGAPLFTNGDGDDADIFGIRWGAIRQRGVLAPTRKIWRRSAPAWTCPFEGTEVRETE